MCHYAYYACTFTLVTDPPYTGTLPSAVADSYTLAACLR
jgi:hypothetical protein